MDNQQNQSKKEVKFTYCSICEQACGLKVTVSGNEILEIQPDKENPYSWRDFCIKAKKADEVRSHPVRIRSPLRRVGTRYVEASYEEAIEDISEKIRALMAESGPDAIGVYSGNPAGFGFANSAFQNAFFDALGSKQRFWVGSIDQNALHYVAEQMYGSNWASLQLDVDHCKCFLFLGTNPAVSGLNWVGKVPDGWRRVLRAVDQGADLILVDPRQSESAKKATLHIAAKPDQDWAFLLAIINTVFSKGWDNPLLYDDSTGIDEIKRLALSADTEELANVCGVPLDQIAEVAHKFATAPTAMCVARTGPAMGKNGAITEWLSHVLNLITGRTDQEGGRFLPDSVVDLFSLDEGEAAPNKIPSRVRGIPPVAGSYSLAELPDEITTGGRGQVRGLLINGGNPIVSGPRGAKLDAALQTLDLLVVVDLIQRESHRHADWIIPGIHFLERGEVHITSAGVTDEPFVQSATQCVEPPVGVRHEWEFFRDLAEAIGKPLFGGGITLDPDGMADAMLSRKGRLTLEEIRKHPHGLKYGEKTYGHLRKSLRDRGRKIQACPADLKRQLQTLLESGQSRKTGNTGRYQMIGRRRLQMMNSWLAETCGSSLPDQAGEEIEINAEDAKRQGLASGDRVVVSTEIGSVEAIVVTSDKVRQGVVVMDHGWGSRVFDPLTGQEFGKARGVQRNELISGDDLAPLTGVPRLNGMTVKIERCQN